MHPRPGCCLPLEYLAEVVRRSSTPEEEPEDKRLSLEPEPLGDGSWEHVEPYSDEEAEKGEVGEEEAYSAFIECLRSLRLLSYQHALLASGVNTTVRPRSPQP